MMRGRRLRAPGLGATERTRRRRKHDDLDVVDRAAGAAAGAGSPGAARQAAEERARGEAESQCAQRRDRASMRGILMEPGRFAEAPQQIRGKLETAFLGGQLSRHAKLQWSFEGGTRVRPSGFMRTTVPDRCVSAPRTAPEPPCAPDRAGALPGARAVKFEFGDAQQALRHGRQRAKTIVDSRSAHRALLSLSRRQCLCKAHRRDVYVADVDLRQERRQAQLDLGGGGQRLVEHRLRGRP